MTALFRKQLVVGSFQCNCQVLACEESREAIIIDPGDEAGAIIEVVEAHQLKVKALLHTHAHLDHIGATRAVHQKFQSPIHLHRGDEQIYQNLVMQGQMFGIDYEEPPPVSHWLNEGSTVEFGAFKLSTIHTPGHSPGSVCFQLDCNEQLLFSGDTLFKAGIGRTDLWGGSMETILDSIHARLMTLPQDTHVFPGHGEDTYIGQEHKQNPFINT